MLKRLAILAITAWFAVCVSGQPNKTSGQKQSVGQNVNPAPISTNSVDKEANGQANQSKADAYPKRWYTALERPDWWLVLAAFCTLGVISWQSVETRKAAQGAKENAIATNTQIQLMREKERARLYVKPGIVESFKDDGTGGWFFRVRVEVENAGNSRAYGIGSEVGGRGCIWIQSVSAPIVPPNKFPLPGLGKYISERAVKVRLDSQILPVVPDTIEQALYGDEAIFLQGSIKYETVGKRFCKCYGYRWWTGSFDRTGLNFGSKFIEGRWMEDDQQDNSETEIP